MEKMLGVMLDCSRNAVMRVETVKKYAEIIKQMGYNTLMLYTEDTYEVNNQPFFGHLRGRYSKAEIKEMDSFCKEIGLELIPCIQTLAHLENLFKWNSEYDEINDCDNILLANEEKTYDLIEDMISTVSECFSSRKIHIGMDEAYRVGTGKYQKKNGIEDRFDIINKHLHRVCEITDKYGFEPMIWSDMFCRLALDIENQYENAENDKILEKAALPENITLVYWDYYSTDYNHYVQQIKTNKMFGRKVYFAGGAWSWRGLAPDNTFSIDTMKSAIRACNDCEVDGMLFTVWGDNGAECSKFAVLPSLMYASQAVARNTNIEDIKNKFTQATDCEFDDFMLLDMLDRPGGKHNDNPSKYLLYNDPFMGIRDYCCVESDNKFYENLENQLKKVKCDSFFEEMFEHYKKLSKVLSIKAALGIKTRIAYLQGNKAELGNIIEEYNLLLSSLQEFYDVFQKMWFKENKPHGFEVQDIRIGGLMQRLVSCKKRLVQFVNNEISTIEELEEPVLEKSNGHNFWDRIVTANAL
ncbi:MAG: beta-N-acetylhexosaminidase [Clostridia bacterium]|nr:beta-N-acetylhexosaminidase [Clostridia bacterium]